MPKEKLPSKMVEATVKKLTPINRQWFKKDQKIVVDRALGEALFAAGYTGKPMSCADEAKSEKAAGTMPDTSPTAGKENR